MRILGSSGLDIGCDTHAPITRDYEPPFRFSGLIERIAFHVRARPSARDAAATLRAEMGKE